MVDETKKIFPKDFLWGASTSAHQVEGGNHNQWSVWELENAENLAKNTERSNNPLVVALSKSPLWGEIKDQVQDPNNYISGRGVEHYKRYEEDFNLVKQLNLNAFRFSIEWSRIEPSEGQWDKDAIAHYRNYIRALRSRGIEPIMNLWHWTNPVWFEEKGAFVKRKNLKYFERFVTKVSEELCINIRYVLTINEANSYASFSYYLGVWPPQQKSTTKMLKVYHNLMLAHRRAYKILKHANPALKIGAAHQATKSTAIRPYNIIDWVMAKGSAYFWQGWFYRRIKRHQDFIGMNFYFKNYWHLFSQHNPKKPLNDLGWYMEPAAVGPLALQLHKKYKKPIIITENGVADMHDRYRKWWLEQTLESLNTALKQGADIKGYVHWSLLDNFEWAEGWWPKFGLVAVDRQKGMKRTVRESAKWFSERIAKL